MTEVAFWSHAVQFAPPDKTVQQRSALTTMVGTEEQEVFATQAEG